MTAPGPQDPTISYLVYRGMLISLMFVIMISAGFLVFREAPDIQEWVLSTIQAVRDEWTSWNWRLW